MGEICSLRKRETNKYIKVIASRLPFVPLNDGIDLHVCPPQAFVHYFGVARFFSKGRLHLFGEVSGASNSGRARNLFLSFTLTTVEQHTGGLTAVATLTEDQRREMKEEAKGEATVQVTHDGSTSSMCFVVFFSVVL